MARGQRRKLIAPAVEECVVGDEERASLPLDEGSEGGVDLAFAAGIQDLELNTLYASRFLRFSHQGPGDRAVWVHDQGDHPGLGDQLGQQLKPLGRQLGGDDAEAREVAARPGQAGDEARRDRIATAEDDRDRRGCVFRRDCRDAALGLF